MAILEKEVLVTLNNNHKYYKEIGYGIPTHEDAKGKYKVKKGVKILVKTEDLPKSSNYEVTKICDQCDRNVGEMPYFAILKQRKNNNGKDICKKCKIRNREIEKAKGNSLLEKFPNISKEWVKCLKEGYEDYTPDMVSIKSNHLVLWKCSKEDCKDEWNAKISDRTNGSGCPACWGRVASDKNRLSLIFPELIEEWHPTKNGDLKPYDVTYASHKEVWWKCKNDHEWKTPVHSRTIMLSNCPECAESKGERRIRAWLEENGIVFKPQQEFHDLIGIGGRLLSYDFYLTEYNLLLEYQGEFHDGSGNDYMKLNLATQQEHDRRKKEYAKSNNIELLEIWYWDFDNIEDILERRLVTTKEELNVRK